MLWASKAAQMRYSWHIGDGRKVRFWEDQWFGNSSLAIQYWPLYCIVNEKGTTVAEAWDGKNLKFTLRTVSPQTMNLWHELVGIAESITFSNDQDSLIWRFNSNGVYSVQSLYAVVNFRGVK